ncbi:MAG: glycosyl transferase [Solibacterales bacterium]|nr:glycosyl transferase [Bryobacterales bacterium]
MYPSLSVVIPSYNEEKRLPPALDRVVQYLMNGHYRDPEIIIVNDGSSDRTSEVARGVAAEFTQSNLRIRVLDNSGNYGKGYSVRRGANESTGEWLLVSDADLSAPIEECDKLFTAVKEGNFDAAIGSRALDRSLIGVRQLLLREFIGRTFNVAVRLIAGLPFADTQCGFKLFSRQLARRVFAAQSLERFGFDVEILYLAKKFGFRVVEVPIRWDDVAGTKVATFSGADAFLDILRVRRNDWLGKYD